MMNTIKRTLRFLLEWFSSQVREGTSSIKKETEETEETEPETVSFVNPVTFDQKYKNAKVIDDILEN